MKSYESIDYWGDNMGLSVVAFDKLDGSNLRFEMSQKKGLYKSGTRNMMIDENNEPFGFAVKLFLEKYGDGLMKVFKTKEYRDTLSFVCFAELVGKNSKYGQHDFGKDEFDVVLFDVNQYKKGLVPPKRFIKDFGHLGIPKVVYEGNLNMDLVNAVKRNDFGLTEGVICKGQIPNKKEPHNLYYCKIKTDEWFSGLRALSTDAYLAELKQTKYS